jgi:DTW domain-containing protein YfiP
MEARQQTTPAATERRIRSRRLARCGGCRLSDELCICAMLELIAVRTRVVLVTHRNETWKTSNTGRLVARALAGAARRFSRQARSKTIHTGPARLQTSTDRRQSVTGLSAAKPMTSTSTTGTLVAVRSTRP